MAQQNAAKIAATENQWVIDEISCKMVEYDGRVLKTGEESVGLGRLHHPGHRAVQSECASGRARVQLVVMVLPSGQAGCTHGGHHQSSTATGGGWASHTKRRTNDAPSDTAAWQGQSHQAVDRQYPCGSAVCKRSCGADQINQAPWKSS